MTVSPDGVSVMFDEPRELFDVERSSAKPNTVKFIDAYEADQIRNKPPTKIFISCHHEIFIRTLTDIHLGGEILGRVIATFSWANEEHHHSMSKQDPNQKAHNMSLSHGHHSVPYKPGNHNPRAEEAHASEEPPINERFAAITISNGTLALLQSIAHGRTMDSIIRVLHEAYLDKKAKERGPLHD